jgi:predicted nuclease with TOPRIM domain
MNNKLDKILAEISPGELIDKITILEIKKIKIEDTEKLKDIEKELSSLNDTLKNSISDISKIQELVDKLKSINLKLWDIENGKRLAEKNNDFGEKFIELARSVYKNNDKRAKIKLEINNFLGSNIKEVKSHY